jgi:uncharacterized protein
MRTFAAAVASLATLPLVTTAAESATGFTGDVIQGKRVISALDVHDLEPGQKHSFYFQGVQMGTGRRWE